MATATYALATKVPYLGVDMIVKMKYSPTEYVITKVNPKKLKVRRISDGVAYLINQTAVDVVDRKLTQDERDRLFPKVTVAPGSASIRIGSIVQLTEPIKSPKFVYDPLQLWVCFKNGTELNTFNIIEAGGNSGNRYWKNISVANMVTVDI